MSDFGTAYRITGANEGGWQNDPADHGNDDSGLGTYKGIAVGFNPKWKGWGAVREAIAKKPPQPPYGTRTYRDWVKGLNAALEANTALQGMVQDFYRVNYWDVNRLTELNSQAVANKVYDCGVNQGVGTAAMLLQKCLGVMQDGNIGPVTIKAANGWDGAELAAAFRAARVEKYKRLVAAKPEYRQYLDVWLARC